MSVGVGKIFRLSLLMFSLIRVRLLEELLKYVVNLFIPMYYLHFRILYAVTDRMHLVLLQKLPKLLGAQIFIAQSFVLDFFRILAG
jgi:hypothetical protein